MNRDVLAQTEMPDRADRIVLDMDSGESRGECEASIPERPLHVIGDVGPELDRDPAQDERTQSTRKSAR